MPARGFRSPVTSWCTSAGRSELPHYASAELVHRVFGQITARPLQQSGNVGSSRTAERFRLGNLNGIGAGSNPEWGIVHLRLCQ